MMNEIDELDDFDDPLDDDTPDPPPERAGGAQGVQPGQSNDPRRFVLDRLDAEARNVIVEATRDVPDDDTAWVLTASVIAAIDDRNDAAASGIRDAVESITAGRADLDRVRGDIRSDLQTAQSRIADAFESHLASVSSEIKDERVQVERNVKGVIASAIKKAVSDEMKGNAPLLASMNLGKAMMLIGSAVAAGFAAGAVVVLGAVALAGGV